MLVAKIKGTNEILYIDILDILSKEMHYYKKSKQKIKRSDLKFIDEKNENN